MHKTRVCVIHKYLKRCISRSLYNLYVSLKVYDIGGTNSNIADLGLVCYSCYWVERAKPKRGVLYSPGLCSDFISCEMDSIWKPGKAGLTIKNTCRTTPFTLHMKYEIASIYLQALEQMQTRNEYHK